MSRVQPDCWSNNPARVSTFLEFPASLPPTQGSTYSSPRCGLGWRFDLAREYTFTTSSSSPDLQEKRGRITVTFRSDLCRRMPYRNITIEVKAKYFGQEGEASAIIAQNTHQGLGLDSDARLSTYEEPFRPKARIIIEVIVTFDPNDQLYFPITPSSELNSALASSLDGEILVDTKFYLFSGRCVGRPTSPRAVFGNAGLLKKTSMYFADLLSGAHFQDGVLCGIREDISAVRERLKPESYDYSADSDLEEELPLKAPVNATDKPLRSLPDTPPPCIDTLDKEDITTESNTSGNLLNIASPPKQPEGSIEALPQGPWPDPTTQVHAYAINGFAYRTWKAFIFYAYTNEIHFSPLKSKSRFFPEFQFDRIKNKIACSPKSMYRLADYINLPVLKALAKEGILNSLTETNVVDELFSSFTSKYDEIIELEADFLVNHFTLAVSANFDDVLDRIAAGQKPHCSRALSFTVKRLHGDSATSAWENLRQNAETNGRTTRVSVGKRGKKGTKK